MAHDIPCRVDPAVAAELARYRPYNDFVSVTIIVRRDLRPSPPWTDAKSRRFNHFVDELLYRVADTMEEDDEIRMRPHVEGLMNDHTHGAIALDARVELIDKLLKQPEVAECLDGEAYLFLDEREDIALG